jgi:gas vesicle protein
VVSSNQPTWEEKIAALRRRYDDLRDKINMGDVTRTLGDTATEIAGLPGEIALLRQRGYAFASYLERKAEVLKQQWDEVRQQVQRVIDQEIERVQRQFDELTSLWRRLETQASATGKEQQYNLVSMSIETLEKAVDGARSRIEGLYGQVPENVSQTTTQIGQIKRYLDLADEATVTWKPAEAVFMVVEAEWKKTGKGKEDPDGVLYLTDQRLVFEQKEKVGGRFGLGGEKVQQVLFETPVGAITGVVPEDKGLFGGKDLIHLKLSSGDYAETTFEVKTGGVDSKWYAQQLNRAISGEIDKERAIPVDQQAAEAAKAAPTACPTCGATLPPVTRGMTELTCQYCGSVVRL